MINHYLLAFRQLGDRRLLKPVILASMLSLFTLVILIIIGTSAAGWVFDSLLSYFDSYEKGSWIRIAAQSFIAVFLFLLGFFFFGSIHAGFLGLFIDDIIDAIQEKHHPDLILRPAPKMLPAAIISMRLIGLSLFVNLIASPLFLIGWFLPPLGIILQIGLNGFLLGREYKVTIAQRLPEDFRQSSQSFALYGTLGATLWMIPFLNFFAPLLICASVFHAQAKNNQQ